MATSHRQARRQRVLQADALDTLVVIPRQTLIEISNELRRTLNLPVRRDQESGGIVKVPRKLLEEWTEKLGKVVEVMGRESRHLPSTQTQPARPMEAARSG